MPQVARRTKAAAAPRAAVVERGVAAGQQARLEGTFTADLVHDVLVRAHACVTGSSASVQVGASRLLDTHVTTDAAGHLVYEDKVALEVIVTTRRELSAMVDLLDRAHVEDGHLTLAPVAHTVTTKEAQR